MNRVPQNPLASPLRAVMLAASTTRAAVTLESLLTEMTGYTAVSRWAAPEFTCACKP